LYPCKLGGKQTHHATTQVHMVLQFRPLSGWGT